MKAGLGLIVTACLLAGGTGLAQDPARKDDEAVKKELASLRGSWQIVEKEFMGKKAKKEELAMLKGDMVIKDHTLTQWADDAGEKSIVSEATFKIDPAARPRALDLTYTKDVFQNKGRKSLAIYEVTADTLKVCYSMEEGQRPTEFAGGLDGKAFFLVYKRVKK